MKGGPVHMYCVPGPQWVKSLDPAVVSPATDHIVMNKSNSCSLKSAQKSIYQNVGENQSAVESE